MVKGEIASNNENANSLTPAGKEPSDQAIQTAVASADALIAKLPSIEHQELKVEARESVNAVVGKLNEVAVTKPEAATTALQQIATSADRNGSTQVKAAAVSSLQLLKDNPKLEDTLREKAGTALKKIEQMAGMANDRARAG